MDKVPARPGWVIAFSTALRELRPDIGLNFALTVAHSVWANESDKMPELAAKQWAARAGKPTS